MEFTASGRLTPAQIAANQERNREQLAERVRASEARREAEAQERLDRAITQLVEPARLRYLADGGDVATWPTVREALLIEWRYQRARAAMMGESTEVEEVRQLRETDPAYSSGL